MCCTTHFQTVEKGPSASLRSTASLQRTAQVRLRSSISRAPCIWDLFDRPENRGFQPSILNRHRTCLPLLLPQTLAPHSSRVYGSAPSEKLARAASAEPAPSEWRQSDAQRKSRG